jgi:hypothetical protein
MTHVNLGLEVVQDRFPLQFLRRGEEPVLRSPLDVGQDNRLEGLHTSPSRMGTGGRRRNPQSAQQAQRKKTTKAHHDKRKTHLEPFQFGLLAGRVQFGEDPFPDLVVLAHFGRPVEVVDVLVAWAEQLWLGCEELTQVVLVRDNDLSQMCASGSCSNMQSKCQLRVGELRGQAAPDSPPSVWTRSSRRERQCSARGCRTCRWTCTCNSRKRAC